MSSSTVKIDHYNQSSPQLRSGEYDGLAIYAMEELHPIAGQRAAQHVPAGGKILDLAAGSGALTQRLRDLGFSVSSADLAGESFKLHGQGKFYQVDFNTDFYSACGGPYDAVTALEIIEHLENPRHFLRQCMALLKPGGVLILTTPNIDTPRSILRFLTHGHFRLFSDEDYEVTGHITPLSQWQLRKMMEEGRWQALETFSCGKAFGGGLRHMGAKLLSLCMQANRNLRGPFLVMVLQKPQ